MQTIKLKLIRSNDTCQKEKKRDSQFFCSNLFLWFLNKNTTNLLCISLKFLNCSQVSDSQVKSILLSSGKYEETIFILK